MIERTIDTNTLKFLAFKDEKYFDYVKNGPSQCNYFLERLYGLNPPGWLLVCTKGNVTTYPISTIHNEEIVKDIMKSAATKDIMFEAGLRRNAPETATLMEDREIVAMPGLWMTIPIKGPTHQEKNIPSSIGEGLKFLKAQRMKPDIIIDTGYELQAHWIIEPLSIFTGNSENIFDRISADDFSFNEFKQLSHDFQQEIISAGKKYRWQLHDTSSVLTRLRVPGTFNWTLYPPKPVTILEPKKNVWKVY